MNTKLATQFFWLVVLLALTGGCESSRSKPSGVYPGSEPRNLRPARPPTTDEILAGAAAQPGKSAVGDGWQPLFDGVTLSGWRITPFSAGGAVSADRGMIVCQAGEPFTGVNYTNPTPTMDYEVTLEAMRVAGSDFFCGLTFPVSDSSCSLIVGGWGGSLVGLSSLDDEDASENETTQIINFETGQWYRIRLRVTGQKIEAWIEQKKVVDVVTTGRKISLRPGEIELSKPFGLACWSTTAAFRAIRIRPVGVPAPTASHPAPAAP